MNDWIWMDQHMAAGGHGLIMLLWWFLIITGLVAVGYVIGRNGRGPRDKNR